jgi:hypothetical protein
MHRFTRRSPFLHHALRAVGALSLLIGAAAPADAAYRTAAVRSAGTFSALALAGDHVMLGSTAGSSTKADTLESVAPGTAAALQVRIVHSTAHDHALRLAFGSSQTTLAVTEYGFAGGVSSATRLRAGPVGGPLKLVESCGAATQFAKLVSPAVDGTLTAFAGGACSTSKVLLHDTTGAVADRTVDAGGPITGLALAGDYLAVLAITATTTSTLTLYDVATDTTVTTAAVATPRGADVDVQADGTAVVSAAPMPSIYTPPFPCGTAGATNVQWISAASPTLHDVPITTCGLTVRVAGGRVAYLAAAGGETTLTSADLDGTNQTPVARFGAFPDSGIFDYDGTTYAWYQTGCRNWSIRTRAASDPSAPVPALTCRVSVGTPKLGRDGIHVRISCPDGCLANGGLGLGITSPGWLRKGLTGFSLRPGQRKTIVLPVTSSARARLARLGHQAVRIKVVAQHVYLPKVLRTLHAH